jgi:hypothetical protein
MPHGQGSGSPHLLSDLRVILPGMPDDAIPETLLTAQRAYDDAEKALAEALAAGVAGRELAELRTTVRAAVVTLHRARTEAGGEWASYQGQQKVQKAARDGD